MDSIALTKKNFMTLQPFSGKIKVLNTSSGNSVPPPPRGRGENLKSGALPVQQEMNLIL